MGRPPLPIGAHGNIKTKEIRPRVWQARCRVRDADGVTRPVKRVGRSSSAAANALRAALTERCRPGAGELDGSSRVREAGERWLAVQAERLAADELAPRTLEAYRAAWRLHVEPALGDLRLLEATTARCEAWQRALRQRRGPELCRTAKAVLGGTLGYAVRLGAIPTNPLRDTSPITGRRRRQPRAMTPAELRELVDWLDTHVAKEPRRKRRDKVRTHDPAVIASRALGDVVRLMAATGCRIGEVMALSWDEVDLRAGTVAIRWHLVWVSGTGLLRQPGAKSAAGERLIRLPSRAVAMLERRRRDGGGSYPVFPDILGGWRNPQRVIKWLRWSADECGMPWFSSHVLRQTVVTTLTKAGLPNLEVADHVGHADVEQTQDYMARGVASERAAAVLESLLP